MKNTSFTSAGGFRLLDASVLKYIAVVTMLIDHAALCLIYNVTLKPAAPISRGTSLYTLYLFYKFLRGVGRIAFPIFCFFLVEGFVYTKNRRLYALRLLVFGIISEVPFDLCSKLRFPYNEHQNVMFELLFGLLMLSMWEYFDGRKADALLKERPDDGSGDQPSPHKKKTEVKAFLPAALKNEHVLTLLQVLSAAAFMAAAQFLHLDYGFKGLGLILILYLLRSNRLVQCAAGAVSISVWELPAVLSFLLLFLYSGKRGRQSRYFFYAFYPAHLLILYFIARIMTGMR